jgi:hypothetical protein
MVAPDLRSIVHFHLLAKPGTVSANCFLPSRMRGKERMGASAMFGSYLRDAHVDPIPAFPCIQGKESASRKRRQIVNERP